MSHCYQRNRLGAEHHLQAKTDVSRIPDCRGTKRERAQLVMHVARKDHRESSPPRRWRNIIIVTMTNVKLTHSLLSTVDARTNVAEIECYYTVSRTSHTDHPSLSFVVAPSLLPSFISQSVSLVSVFACDESQFQFCFRMRAINLLWTS